MHLIWDIKYRQQIIVLRKLAKLTQAVRDFISFGVEELQRWIDLGMDGSHFSSIPDAFWWSLTTVSTVGYGDYYPITGFGKVVGGICAVFGVLAFSLPVMAFAKNFNAYLKGEPIRKHIENTRRSPTKRITSDLSG